VATAVYVQDVTTQRVHVRLRDEGSRSLYSPIDEDRDTSGAFRVLTDDEMERVDLDTLCRRCFPKGGDS
jgi:hypothetical protein